jgi:uncharacterized membrane-anchored protein YhcB (DUF1043 family)
MVKNNWKIWMIICFIYLIVGVIIGYIFGKYVFNYDATNYKLI